MARIFTPVSAAATTIFELKHFRTNTHVVVVAVESSLAVTTTLKFSLWTEGNSKERRDSK